MNKDIFFMPLGGGQRVGASCYYLRLGSSNILLDAGIGRKNGTYFFPKLLSLTTTNFMMSLSQLNQIFISHAHSDHVGYLFQLMREAGQTPVYMTELTKILTEYQLYDKNFILRSDGEENARLAARNILDRITTVNYMQPMNFGKYRAAFFPAGHIPGAMMTLFHFGKRNILYTGDYSVNPTILTGSCILPEKIKIDTLIMCGLHARHPTYRNNVNQLYKTVNDIIELILNTGDSVICQCSQLSKGIEFIKAVNVLGNDTIPVYIDGSVMPIVRKTEMLGIPILGPNNYPTGSAVPDKPHIFVTSRNVYDRRYRRMNIDFSLHEDFEDMKKFIKAINPRCCVIVHCAPPFSPLDTTIEQELMTEGLCETQFIFAEENNMYNL